MVKTETKWHNKSRSGFTLLELLVVVGILAALVALALPFYQDYVNQSKLTAAEADLQTFKKAFAMFDQLESKMFGAANNFRSLIGKYLQDYRTFDGQIVPRDPWGNDYVLNTSEGVIYSLGPNGTAESMTGAAPYKRIAFGDDILVSWKPPFYVTGARAINQNTIEVTFSRKINDYSATLSNAFTTSVLPGMTLSGVKVVQKVSDTVYRIFLTTNMTKGSTYTVTVANKTSQDGKAEFDLNPTDGVSAGGVASFIY